MTYEASVEVEFKVGEDYAYKDVVFSGEPTTMETGEDGGEYWGFKYASTIQTVRGCENIEWDRSLYTDSENAIIEAYLNDNYESVDNLICSKE
jgi:hypothetical protein